MGDVRSPKPKGAEAMIQVPAYLHELAKRDLARRALASLDKYFEGLDLFERRELLRKIQEAGLTPVAAFFAGELGAQRRSERHKSSAEPIECWSDEEIIDAARNRFERKH
jgi:hypothetical protein